MLIFTLALVCVVLVVSVILLVVQIVIFKNLHKTIKKVNSAKCCNNEDHYLMLHKLQSWTEIMEKMESLTSVISPIIRRKHDFKNTVDAKKDETLAVSCSTGDVTK